MNLILLEKELTRDEGVRYSPYKDTKGIPTVGIGHNLQTRPLPVNTLYPLTPQQVSAIFQEDTNDVVAQLNAHLPWWDKMDEVRQRVIVNMCFNLGIETLLTFHNTLMFMELGNYSQAAANMQQSAWYVQVGQRAVRLTEAMKTGIMPN
jgi:lysozyme